VDREAKRMPSNFNKALLRKGAKSQRFIYSGYEASFTNKSNLKPIQNLNMQLGVLYTQFKERNKNKQSR
jgi:hypothetical protein